MITVHISPYITGWFKIKQKSKKLFSIVVYNILGVIKSVLQYFVALKTWIESVTVHKVCS